MNQDFLDLLREFIAADVRFLVVGAYAVALHGHPRATAALDVWVEPTAANAERTHAALRAFGAPLQQVAPADLGRPDFAMQMGVEPVRIDLRTSASGLAFADAWSSRVIADIEGMDVPFIGRDALIANKRAVGRPQDLADIDALGG